MQVTVTLMTFHVRLSYVSKRPFRLISQSSPFQILNVDWVHVENRASDIAKSDKGVQLVLGQLIDE